MGGHIFLDGILRKGKMHLRLSYVTDKREKHLLLFRLGRSPEPVISEQHLRDK